MATRHILKRGKVYYARYDDRNGRLRWLSLKTNSKEIARQKFALLEEALEKEELGCAFIPNSSPNTSPSIWLFVRPNILKEPTGMKNKSWKIS